MPLFGDSIDLLNALLAAVLSRSHLLVAHLGARAIRRQTTLQAARVSMRLFGDAPNIPVERQARQAVTMTTRDRP